MASDICPSCGALYNGKKCCKCCFQPLDTDITRSIHKQKGAMRQRGALKQKPIPRKKYKNQKTAVSSLLGFLILLVLIALMLPILRNFGTKLEAIEASQIISETYSENAKTDPYR